MSIEYFSLYLLLLQRSSFPAANVFRVNRLVQYNTLAGVELCFYILIPVMTVYWIDNGSEVVLADT